MALEPTVHLIARGCVQGVGYRAFVADAADGLGVTGWVRNRLDGSVEAQLQGAPGAIAELIELCRRGPAGAVVSSIHTLQETAESLGTFEVRATG